MQMGHTIPPCVKGKGRYLRVRLGLLQRADPPGRVHRHLRQQLLLLAAHRLRLPRTQRNRGLPVRCTSILADRCPHSECLSPTSLIHKAFDPISRLQ